MNDLLALINPDCPGCQALLVIVQKQAQQIAELSERLAKVEEKLAQTSQNSHRPPS